MHGINVQLLIVDNPRIANKLITINVAKQIMSKIFLHELVDAKRQKGKRLFFPPFTKLERALVFFFFSPEYSAALNLPL